MAAPENIILVGFMGTGKTVVSRVLAERLGLERIDTDDLIVERAGKSISDIFGQDGEPHFRDLESEVIRGLRGRHRCVISTGGGCVMRVDNMRALKEAGMVVNLAARPEVVMRRCGGDTNRPLLQVENPLAAINELLGLRAPMYALAHHTVDTSDLSVDQVAEVITALWPGGGPGGH
jgi:shikimate kinase